MSTELSAEPAEISRLDAILDQSAHLFYERGYGSVGMRMIAEVVGVRASTLYHYFVSKTDLLYQISLGVARQFSVELLPLLDGSEEIPERLKIFIQRHIELRWRKRHWISTAQQEIRSLDAEHAAEISGHLHAYQRRVQQFIGDGIANGSFHVTDARLAGIALLDMINGINSWYRPEGTLSIAQIAAAYADMAVNRLLGAGQ